MDNMSSAMTDGKVLVNAAYHAVVVTVLASGYARLGKMLLKAPLPKLDTTASDLGMATVDIGLALLSKDMLIKQGILPPDIMK